MGQVWFELCEKPTEDDLDLLDAVLSSWFMIGRLGGYNTMNLQVRSMRSLHYECLLCASMQHCNDYWISVSRLW